VRALTVGPAPAVLAHATEPQESRLAARGRGITDAQPHDVMVGRRAPAALRRIGKVDRARRSMPAWARASFAECSEPLQGE
jgi:hypothetical protein